ncbi:MAG: 16S rRNA processing protein RimM, partial [Mariprofundaceae bacterium]
MVRPHGLKGAVLVYSHTRPAIGIAGYSFWWLGETPESLRRFTVRRCWSHGKRILANLSGVEDMDAAQALVGARIWIPAQDVQVDEDEY